MSRTLPQLSRPLYSRRRRFKAAATKHITLQRRKTWRLFLTLYLLRWTSLQPDACSGKHFHIDRMSNLFLRKLFSPRFHLFFVCAWSTGEYPPPPTKCKNILKKRNISLQYFCNALLDSVTLKKWINKRDVYIQHIFHTRRFLWCRTTLASARNWSGGK